MNENQSNNINKEKYTKINNKYLNNINESNNYRRRNKSEYNLQDYSLDLPSNRLLNQERNLDVLNNQNNYSHYNLTGNNSNRGMRRSASKSSLNLTKNSQSKSKSKIDFFEDIPKDEMKFEQILRKYGGRKVSGKVFMNYSKQRGEFFDPTLQKGGVSSLNVKDQLRRSNSKNRLNNRSVNISSN
jgi:beta-glucosidase-like glycosyl hydrolase